MNWTEGALARHSRRKGWDKDAARQKQYFAKARARKQDCAPKSPQETLFVPDYIPQKNWLQHTESPSVTRQKSSVSRKRPLNQREECQNTNATACSLVRLKSASDLGNVHTLHPSSVTGAQTLRDTDLEAKRQRLLERTDWTGVGFQKPIIVDFSPKSHYKSKATTSISDPNPGRKHQRLSGWTTKQRGQPDQETQLIPEDGQMIMRIGNHNLQWSRVSNSVRSPTSNHDILSTFAGRAAEQGSSRADSPRSQSSSDHFMTHVSSAAAWDSPKAPPSNRRAHYQTESSTTNTKHSSSAGSHGNSKKAQDRPQYIVQSSPQILYQPQPTQVTRPQFFDIYSPTSEDNFSTLAHTGSVNYDRSEATPEEAQWKDLISANDRSNEEQGCFSNSPRTSLNLAPGISHFQSSYEDQLLIPSGNPEVSEVEEDLQDDELNIPPLVIRSTPASSSGKTDAHLVEDELELPKLPSEQDEARGVGTWSRNPLVPLPTSSSGRSEKQIDPSHGRVLPKRLQILKSSKAQGLLGLVEEKHEGMDPNDGPEEIPEEEEEEEIWKKFVFDEDSAGTRRKAGEEARHQTTEDLRCVATGTPLSDVVEPPSRSSWGRTAENPTSHRGTSTNILETRTRIEVPSSEAAVSETALSNTNTSTIARAGSPKRQKPDFKFHQPLPFIGRLASLPSCTAGPFEIQTSNARKGGRHSRKHRIKGRPDFRMMPDYNSDPIEECSEG
ncbi:hypothetical protein BGZ63DRAFT_430686 [Mariannaea sp. PMI_226]|nr:hypothetical protein BGZ63DRAFT_430686 [Mariannaea sp. PMI_226]